MMAAQRLRAAGAPTDRARPAVPRADMPMLRHRLKQGLNDLKLSLAETQQDLLIEYVALLVQWNAVYNLTAVRDPAEMLSLHLLDSLAIADLVASLEGTDLLDVGTGAGLPGVPMAVVFSKLQVSLVDAVAKKISFLQHVKVALQLANICPIHCRIEALTVAKKPAIIVSRAYSDLRRMIGSIDHLADESTTVIAMKGAKPLVELAALPASWQIVEVRNLHVPFVSAQRCAVVLKRMS